jgi:two-component system, chemotaxis family, CheB/CheR fusion protein
MSAPPDEPRSTQEFEALVQYLKNNRGFDFSGYKRSSLRRRMDKRMQALRVERYSDYLDYLEVHPEEFTQLFNTILINVTGFFRDTAAWDYLTAEVIPQLIAGKQPHEIIRVWSAGCASGEEAYTLAIVLAEALGFESFRQRVKIYATDVDEEALGQARQASYSTRDLQPVAPALRSKYFERAGVRFVFRPDLRRAVIFGRHDLVQDVPISRLDLLVCRNTLMYFNAETQSRILARFHFALNDTGVVFLGKAEMLLTRANLFNPVHLKHCVFVKVSKPTLRDRLLVVAQAGNLEMNNHFMSHARLRDAAFDAVSVAQVVLDTHENTWLINQEARTSFGLLPQDAGRPFYELDLSYRPVELRLHIEQAYTTLRAQHLTNIERFLSEGKTQFLDVHLVPLIDTDSTPLGVSITFHDVTHHRRLQAELEKSRQELETAYEELQSTNEELETTNEELQSTVEELETTNEELQSTNEELETMNEELQSGNEELQTINDELRERTDEVNRAKAFLESILASLHAAAVAVDANLNILMWNAEANNLWGLPEDEVQGQSLMNLDIGLPVEQLRIPVRAVLSGRSTFQEVVLEATNRRGRTIQCRVTCAPLVGPERDTQGVILLMEEWSGHA